MLSIRYWASAEFYFPRKLDFFFTQRQDPEIISLLIVLLALESHSFRTHLVQGFGALSPAYGALSRLGLVFCSYGLKSQTESYYQVRNLC